jgi:hypothetical protein
VDVFTVVSALIVIGFFGTAILLGVFSKRSASQILDWKPTRSPELEAENEIDDVEQMTAALAEIRRRRARGD